jgi:hypothetical protein
VFGMTGCRPKDRDDGPPRTAKLDKRHSFNFESLLESEHLIEFSGVILISIVEPDLLTTLAELCLNTRGLARYAV